MDRRHWFVIALMLVVAGCSDEAVVNGKVVERLTELEWQTLKSKIEHDLVDPGSAQYRSVSVMFEWEGKKVVCGEVNAKNTYGGYAGFKRFVAKTVSGKKVGLFVSVEKSDSSYLGNEIGFVCSSRAKGPSAKCERPVSNVRPVSEATRARIRREIVQRYRVDDKHLMDEVFHPWKLDPSREDLVRYCGKTFLRRFMWNGSAIEISRFPALKSQCDDFIDAQKVREEMEYSTSC